MSLGDVPAAQESMHASFQALVASHGGRLDDPAPWQVERTRIRIAHLVGTDPAGSWVADADGVLVGVAQALVREGVWGLSLLTVDPGHQNAGVGRALLEASLAYGTGSRGWIILASGDFRAVRRYAAAGFELRPAMCANGVPERAGLPDPGAVRPGGEADLELCHEVSRTIRGGAHGPDIDVLRRTGCELLVDPGRGYALHLEGTPKLLAALDDDSATRLLGAALRAAPEGAEVQIEPLTAGQDWAVRVSVAARLRLNPWGPMFVRGELGPLAPYLPNGAYL
jgi:GNAT superfamily N-acetyltransferase